MLKDKLLSLRKLGTKVLALPSLAAMLFSYGESNSNSRAPCVCSDASDRLSMLRGELLSLGELRRTVPHLPHLPPCFSPMGKAK